MAPRRHAAIPAPNRGVMRIAPYVGGEAIIAGRDDVLKLSANENPFGPSPAARAAFKEAERSLSLYPDGAAVKLREAIGRAHDLDPANILCGAGSDELIANLAVAWASAGKRVVYSQYGFLMYRIAAFAAGAEPVAVAEHDFRPDVPALIDACAKDTPLLYLANPNNPTGAQLSRDALEALAEALAPKTLLVIDAAYAEYAADPAYESGIGLVLRHPNVVMLRTFSKIYGLAALRVGWAYAHRDIIDILNRVRGPFNLSTPAIEAACAALQDQSHVRASRSVNERERNSLALWLDAQGIPVRPSEGNFLLAHFGAERAKAAEAHLRAQGILVRNVASYGLSEHLRITIGRLEQNARLRAALAAFAKAHPFARGVA